MSKIFTMSTAIPLTDVNDDTLHKIDNFYDILRSSMSITCLDINTDDNNSSIEILVGLYCDTGFDVSGFAVRVIDTEICYALEKSGLVEKNSTNTSLGDTPYYNWEILEEKEQE